jgi:hypothetical protein
MHLCSFSATQAISIVRQTQTIFNFIELDRKYTNHLKLLVKFTSKYLFKIMNIHCIIHYRTMSAQK